MITFYDLMNNGAFSCDVAGEIDPECSFEWDSQDCAVTEEGYEEFRHVLELPATLLANGNIHLDTSSDPDGWLDREVCRFVNSLAGYCSDEEWNRWFSFSE